MSGFGRKFTSGLIAVSLFAVSTAAAGAAPANPWLTLSALTTSSSATTAAAMAQNDDDDDDDFKALPLVLILTTVGVGIWILLKDDKHHNLGISPA